MNHLFDIACNFTHESFEADLDEVISSSINANVDKFLVVAAELKDLPKINKIVSKFPDRCYFTIGVHPHHANNFTINSINEIKSSAKENMPNAFGEMGLDFFRNLSSQEDQIYAFEEQIKIAIEFNRPIFLHQRDAHDEFINILKKYKNDLTKSVVHCFTGTQKELDEYLECGCYIGLTGWICDERRNKDLRASIQNIPLDRLMVETDCPYLIPRNLNPKPKNNRNDPSNLTHIVNEITSLRSEDFDEICLETYKNSINFFK